MPHLLIAVLLSISSLFAAELPIKAELDAIFVQSRVLECEKSLRKADFHFSSSRKYTHLIVATHPQFPGYIFKLYLDVQRPHKNKPEKLLFMNRVKGAEKIRKLIQKQGWEEMFKVPQKWIYTLPKDPAPQKEYWKKESILVEEDMDLYSSENNRRLWRSEVVTKKFLKTFFTLLDTLGLQDCAKPDNASFSLDGKIAFIDTETHGVWPVHYDKLTPYLSPKVQKYWKRLTNGSKLHRDFENHL